MSGFAKLLNYAFDFEELKRTIFYNQYDRINSYFYGSELASSGLPQGRELEILNELKDQIPPDVFTKLYETRLVAIRRSCGPIFGKRSPCSRRRDTS